MARGHRHRQGNHSVRKGKGHDHKIRAAKQGKGSKKNPEGTR